MKHFTQIIAFINILFCGAMGSTVITPCDKQEDCDHLISAVCLEKVCICNGTRFCTEKITTAVTKIGEKCEVTDECNIDNSECGNDGKCKCLQEFVAAPNGKNCLMVSSGIGGPCEESVQCYTKTAHSGCQNNECVCQQQMRAHNGSCYNSVDLGERCSQDEECSFLQFSECIDSVCTCKNHHVRTSKGARCLPVAEGEKSPCTDDNQCVATLGAASECHDGFCRCKELYQLQKSINKCVRDMLLGEICMKHSDCHGPYPGKRRLECVLGICKCRSYYREVNGYCISSSGNKGASVMLLVLAKYLSTWVF